MKTLSFFLSAILLAACHSANRPLESAQLQGKWHIRCIRDTGGRTEKPPAGYNTVMELFENGRYTMQHFKNDSAVWQYQGVWQVRPDSVLYTNYLLNDSVPLTDSAFVLLLNQHELKLKDLGNTQDTIEFVRKRPSF